MEKHNKEAEEKLKIWLRSHASKNELIHKLLKDKEIIEQKISALLTSVREYESKYNNDESYSK